MHSWESHEKNDRCFSGNWSFKRFSSAHKSRGCSTSSARKSINIGNWITRRARAATAQLANGKYRVFVTRGRSLYIFIEDNPGNEKGVSRIINQFSEMGVDVVEDESVFIMCLVTQIDLTWRKCKIIQPQFLIPMHGEHRHLREHSKLASQNGFSSFVCTNGNILNISANEPKFVDKIELEVIFRWKF